MSCVTVEYAFRGTVLAIDHGYMLKLGDNVAAFCIDMILPTYPVSTCDNVVVENEWKEFPSVCIDHVDNPLSISSDIYFPEFSGWRVHSVSGGKSMAICLVKD